MNGHIYVQVCRDLSGEKYMRRFQKGMVLLCMAAILALVGCSKSERGEVQRGEGEAAKKPETPAEEQVASAGEVKVEPIVAPKIENIMRRFHHVFEGGRESVHAGG